MQYRLSWWWKLKLQLSNAVSYVVMKAHATANNAVSHVVMKAHTTAK